MLVGVFSDLHDNLDNLDNVMDIFHDRGVKTLIFCGDFCSPIPLRQMEKFDGDIHCVFGNNDGERFMMGQIASAASHIHLHGEHASIKLSGRAIAITHYPFYGEALAKSGDFDAVFSGHSHQARVETYGESLWVNPGEAMGWKGKPTCAIYNTETNSAEIMEV